MGLGRLWAVLILAVGSFTLPAGAQTFDSTSDGSDGAYTPVASEVFDPVALGLDLDGDNVFQFTTVTIPAGVTVTLRADKLNMAPVFWLASGAIQIDGTIDLSGGSFAVLKRDCQSGSVGCGFVEVVRP